MPKTLQLRRGTTAQITANTPASGELFVDTDKKTVTVGDGLTAGGTILARDDRVSDVYNRANAVNGFAVSAFNTANGANGLAQSAFNSANTNTTNITAVNGFAQGAYNTANGANGLAAGAFNAANNKQDLLVSGTNIKTINGSSVLGAGNLVVSGGGGGSANTIAITPTTDNLITIGNPTNVEYFPASNLVFSGPLALASNNATTSLQASSNSYIDVIGYSPVNFTPDEFNGAKNGFMALLFNRRNLGAFPQRWNQEIDNLIPGDRITLKFVAGANNQVMDTFTMPLTVIPAPATYGGQAATEWTRFRGQFFGISGDFTPTGNADRPDNGGTGYSPGITTDPKPVYGKTIFFRAEAVQPSFTSNTTLITTQLVGENTGRPIHHSFLISISGKGYLSPTTIFTNQTTGNALSPTNNTPQRVGVYQILIEKQAGTVVTLSSSDYREVLVSNTALAWSPSGTAREPARVYDSANSKIWISSANLIGTVTTTTPLYTYNPPLTSPLIDAGPNMKLYGDPVNNRLISTGKISKAENFRILGTVSSQGTTSNVVYYPTTVSTRYLDSANTGTYTPVRATNGVLLDNAVASNSPDTIKLINVTPEVYELISQNNSTFYVQYGQIGNNSTANLALRTTNQGNNGFYISSYSGIGTGQTEGNWIGASLLNFWQGGVFYTSNSSYSKPTWTYELDNYGSQIAIPTNVVTLTTTPDVINELVTLNRFSAGPGISLLGNANNYPQIYVDGVLTNVNGVDVANNRIITNLPATKWANSVFSNTTIATVSSLNDYATLSDVAKASPAWVTAATTNSFQTSQNYYLGGGTGGIQLRLFNLNTIIGATSPRETQYGLTFSNNNGSANFGQGADRNINYNTSINSGSGPGNDRLLPDNSAILTYNLGVVGGINSNYLYANNVMGTGGISYANTHIGNTIQSTSKIRISAANVFNEDSANTFTAVLFTANNIYGSLRNDSPNVTFANSALVSTTGTVVAGQTIVPPGAPAEARSFRLGGDPFTGSTSDGGFYIKNQNWDLANPSNGWTFESWVCSSYLYQSVYLLTSLNTGSLTTVGDTFMRLEFPFFMGFNINTNSGMQTNNSVSEALNQSIGRAAQASISSMQIAGYNNYAPLPYKWYHLAFVYDPSGTNNSGTPYTIGYLNGYPVGRTNNPTLGSSLSTADWGVYVNQPTYYYNFRVTYGSGSSGVRYYQPAGWDGYTAIRAFTPDLNPYGVSSQRAITGQSGYRYDALDISGGIRMDNTANTYQFAGMPPVNPVGGYLFVEGGALRYRGSSGTITTIANP